MAIQTGNPGSSALTEEQTAPVRTRVRLFIDITALGRQLSPGGGAPRTQPGRGGDHRRPGRRRLQVPQLRDLLQGGHVLVDHPQLYEKWRFTKASHRGYPATTANRQEAVPGFRDGGPVVRKKLHGRTARGTWVQLENTPAAFGKGRLPSMDDLKHLVDYVTYRITRSNVGPWALSRMTERHPMYLSPDLAVPTPLTPEVEGSLTSALRRIEEDDDTTAASADLAAGFPPPERSDPATELGQILSGRSGRGLFGNSDVWVTETASQVAATIMDQAAPTANRGPVGGSGADVSDSEAAGSVSRAPGPGPGQAAVPEGLVSAVVELVNTGPVLLGAYTLAELTAVDAIVDFLEARPSDEVLAEAVRSLSARQLLVTGSNGRQVQVRGDLGIAVAFQQRARMVLDARATGTAPGEPWRTLLIPQPEDIFLVVRIDALGVHELGLFQSDKTFDDLIEWLPKGDLADAGEQEDTTAVLSSSSRAALVTVTKYTAQGSAETAESSNDLVLARHEDQLHVYGRSPDNPATLIPRQMSGKTVRDTLTDLLA